MLRFNKLSEIGIERLKVESKVKSVVSHVDGTVLSKDIDSGDVEIEWVNGAESNITVNHISNLSSVVLMG